jgi:hypothetical protein
MEVIMFRFALVKLTLAATFLPSIPASALADTPRAASCGSAILRDVEVMTDVVPAPIVSVRHGDRRPHDRTSYGYATPGARLRKTYRVTVDFEGMQYVGESSGDAFWNYNPTRLVINDTVAACVAGKHLEIKRPDGKTYRTDIVRVVRSAN